MNNNTISASERNGNMHIRLNGYFSLDSARQLATTISSRYNGRGNVFIHTNEVTEVAPQSLQLFANLLAEYRVPGDRVYLTGERGVELCHDQGQIIHPPKRESRHICSGHCRNCRCRHSEEHGHSHDNEHGHEHTH